MAWFLEWLRLWLWLTQAELWLLFGVIWPIWFLTKTSEKILLYSGLQHRRPHSAMLKTSVMFLLASCFPTDALLNGHLENSSGEEARENVVSPGSSLHPHKLNTNYNKTVTWILSNVLKMTLAQSQSPEPYQTGPLAICKQ